MEDIDTVYRIRTKVGNDAPNVIHVPLNQTYNMFEILSLKLNQINTYKTYESNYGIIVGRVYANGGVGVENAKISIFIEVSEDDSLKDKLLYNFTSVSGTDNDGIRYNTLPDYVDDACHQNVGTFPNKRLVLDNEDIIEMFDKYWKYTTRTNHAGDYMIWGIPVGSQTLHVDVDLSDCGILSQRPRDMIAKGYNETMFESPNKFKHSTNLNSLAQIVSQDKGVYVYPYWGDAADGDDKFAITRCDISLEYEFEPTAVFMGSIITDKGSNAIGKNCAGTENNGRMSDLIAGEGNIEMIRKTIDGKVEEYPINGNRLIDNDGVFCYSIPMNLDYVTTDEFGNLVPTDNPDKGIATRTRVRFRISLDENPNDATARKRARYLVPNNPRMGDEGFEDAKMEPDYEFGSATRDESFCDLFWNKVYTVKNYIPKLQKNKKETNRKHTGIKLINHHDDNNPMPYNSLTIKLSFTYRLICIITKIVIQLVEFLNETISLIGASFCLLLRILDLPLLVFKGLFGWIPFGIGKKIVKIFKKLWNAVTWPIKKLINLLMPPCIGLSSEFCDDGVNPVTYYPGCGYFYFRLFPLKSIGLDCVWEKTKENHESNQLKICENENLSKEDCQMALTVATNKTAMLYNCVENELAQSNDATSFNFYNDWINGTLYAPLWYRKITPKKSFFFGLFKRKAKDQWCSADRTFGGLRIIQQCAVERNVSKTDKNFDNKKVDIKYVDDNTCGNDCHKTYRQVDISNGLIKPEETMLGQTVYYYKPVEYDDSLISNSQLTGSNKEGEIKLLFATDIVLLGSLNDCDINGVPQFFKTLESTTYNLPSDILFTDYDFIMTVTEDGETGRKITTLDGVKTTSEMAGCDWGNPNEFDKTEDSGLFYSIGCSKIQMQTKSCVNLSRICEYGVSLDETKFVPDLAKVQTLREDDENDISEKAYDELVTDGFVSYDELYNLDERSMFATMNGNKLKTKLNKTNGLKEYDFRYLYPENFDGSLRKIMYEKTKKYKIKVNYKNNYRLETTSRDYYLFRMGNCPYYYDSTYAFPRYENSFYFYFGLKAGKTAIEKFNSKYFAECYNNDNTQNQIGIRTQANSWCSGIGDTENDGYIAFDFSNVETPYSLIINGVTDITYSASVSDITDEKIYISNSKLVCDSDKCWFDDYKQLKDSDGNIVPMPNNGSYKGTVTDANGNISEFTFKLSEKFLAYKENVQDFEQPNNVLLDTYGNDMDTIASVKDGLDTSDIENITREIGGVVTVYGIRLDGEKMNIYTVEIRPQDDSNLDWDGMSVLYRNGSVYYYDRETGSYTLINDRSYKSLLYYDTTNHVYAFGLPQGGYAYTITVTQRCDDGAYGIDSSDSVSINIVVNNPMPYKMYINEIDYDLIKNFDNYTGWTIGGKVSNSTYGNFSIDLANNPWFHVDNVFSDNVFNNIDELYVKENDNNIYYLDENGNEQTIGFDKVWNEFTVANISGIYYNWINEYVVSGYEKDDASDIEVDMEDFIDDVNDVLELRKELPSLMKSVFYISCEGQSKNIDVRVETEDLPGEVTMIYHEEVAQEDEDYNILESNNVKHEDISAIDDITIPTISYNSSSEFGNDDDDDSPCAAQVNGIKKKPYSVGCMNNKGISIPKDSNGKSFGYSETDGIKYINHTSTNAVDMFNFPLIDNILKCDYIAWSAFVNLPKFGVDEPAIVNMHGLLSGYTINGNVTNDEFETQTLHGIKIKLSENVNSSNVNTYVEKRIFNGYDEDALGTWAVQLLSSIASDEVAEQLNNVLGTSVFTDSTMKSLVYSDGKINYGAFSVNLNEVLEYILNFKNYIIQNGYGNRQYCFILPSYTALILQDENYCGINYPIDGELKVELSENSVNNCKTGEKILEIDTENNTYYSIFRAKRNNTDSNGYEYPLNLAVNNNIIWQINSIINGLLSRGSEQNMFSYQMKTKYLRGEGDLLDTNFHSQTLISGDDEEETYDDTVGYGTTGLFTPSNVFNYPVFIVGENEYNVRMLSPVYDYSNVVAVVKFGIVERGEVSETEDENGNKSYSIEVTENYSIGIAVQKGEQYYLNKYDYRLSGVLQLDNLTSITIDEKTLTEPDQYIFTSISESLYKVLKNKYGSASGILATTLIKQFSEGTTITAYDYTGLKHICGVESLPKETTWYSFIWFANVPEDAEGVGMKYGNNNELVVYLEQYFEKDEDLTDKIPPEIKETSDCKFVGWTENTPLGKGETYTSIVFPTKVSECKVYFGNWKSVFSVEANFYQSDGTTLIRSFTDIENDTIVGEVSEIAQFLNIYAYKTWYVRGDASMNEVDFSTFKLERTTDFIMMDIIPIKWIDNE